MHSSKGKVEAVNTWTIGDVWVFPCSDCQRFHWYGKPKPVERTDCGRTVVMRVPESFLPMHAYDRMEQMLRELKGGWKA